MSEALAHLLRVLGEALPSGTDAHALADALWLAAAAPVGEGDPSAAGSVTAGTAPGGAPDPAPSGPGRTPADARPAADRAENSQVSVRRTGATRTVRGVPLTLERGSALPDALAVGRAVQPFRTPWRRGGRSRLDIEATVEHYARGGPLVPLFRPASEPWFEAVVLVDSSLSMSVWEETTRALTGLLRGLGGFRAVHTWRLDWPDGAPRVRDHHGRPVPGDRVPHHGSGPQGRRLVLVVSDCAARAWHTSAPWLLLRDWGAQIPVALLDPLPPRLWRRSALNHPAARVTGGPIGLPNSALRFRSPSRPGRGAAGGEILEPWAALPVVSCTARSLGGWASTLMRADPRGCDAVLVPATGRVPQRHAGTAPARQADARGLAEAFVHTAPAPAVRLAVLSSSLPELALPLLHVLREQAVPEARFSDLAEVLTAGLLKVRRDVGDEPVLLFHPEAREYLRSHLTTHDVWQVERAFSHHVATHPYAPQGIAAVLHDAAAAAELPAQLRPFARAVTGLRHVLEPAHGTGRALRSENRAGRPGLAGTAHTVYTQARRHLRECLDPATPEGARRDAELLLRHLIEYMHSRLPAPLGDWPGEDTYFDQLYAENGIITPFDLSDAVRRHPLAVDILPVSGLPLDLRNEFETTWCVVGDPAPAKIRMEVREDFSWDDVSAEVRLRRAGDVRPPSAVDFFLILDVSEKPEGLRSLADCVAVVEPTGPGEPASVVLRMQTRHRVVVPTRTQDLADLHLRAGRPTVEEILRLAAQESPPVRLDPATLARWLVGQGVPLGGRSLKWLTDFLGQRADGRGERPGAPGPAALGVPVGELADWAPPWPPYVVRVHDLYTNNVIRDCVAGDSRLVLLVGATGSGKTRSCLEALRLLPDDWRVWQPESSGDLDAVLSGAAPIGPRTAVWLGDAERHLLDPADGPREHIAEGLLTRLRDPQGGPVLILGTLREESWQSLTASRRVPESDPHRQARALIRLGTRIQVPLHLGEAELAAFRDLAATDPRLAEVMARTRDGEVIPWFATAAVQTERYHSVPPEARALVDAAVDARRHGHGAALPLPLLVAAAVGYLTGEQRQHLAVDWAERALAGLADDGPGSLLVRVPPSPGEPKDALPRYRLSEHIEQYGRGVRHDLAPPNDLWEALAAYAAGPEDLEAVARVADEHGATDRATRFRLLARLPEDAADGAQPRTASAGEPQETLLTLTEAGARRLRGLLQRDDLTAAEVRSAVARALEWLRTDGGSLTAQFVYNGLLGRADLSAGEAAEAVEHAVDWLDDHGGSPAAQFVLGRLLERDDLDDLAARRTLICTLAWLSARGDTKWAQFVLRPALLRKDLSPEQADLLIRLTLRWLEAHGDTSASQFVLSAALRRTDLTPTDHARFVDAAVNWMLADDNFAMAKFPLRPLLQRTDLTPEQARKAREISLAWLRAHGGDFDAQFVLNALLYRDDLPQEQAHEAAYRALAWLRQHGDEDAARFVLRPLVRRTDLNDDIVAEAAEWAATARHNRAEAAGDGARHGIMLVVDIAGFGATEHPDVMRRRLYEILARVLREPDPPWESFDTGDGVCAFLPVRTDILLPLTLLTRLRAEFDGPHRHGGLRLRIALHRGDLVREEGRWLGRDLTVLMRLADSPALRSALRSSLDAPFAVMMSDDMYRHAYHAPTEMRAAFRAVHVTTEEQVLKGWVWVAGHEQPPGVEAWTEPPLDDVDD